MKENKFEDDKSIGFAAAAYVATANMMDELIASIRTSMYNKKIGKMQSIKDNYYYVKVCDGNLDYRPMTEGQLAGSLEVYSDYTNIPVEKAILKYPIVDNYIVYKEWEIIEDDGSIEWHPLTGCEMPDSECS